MSYDARDRGSIRFLAMALMALPRSSRPAVAARIIAERIMLPSQRWVRFCVWLVKKRHGLDTYAAWSMVLGRAPNVADELIGQTADWIVGGKDADGEGVGGLNQREVEDLARIISMCRSRPYDAGRHADYHAGAA